MPKLPSDSDGASIPGIGVARLLPSSVRGGLKRDVVFFQIEELNAVFDLLCARRSVDGARERARTVAQERVDQIVRAARLVSEVAVRNAWAFAETETERPEDLFGPAVLLLALAAEDPPVRRWAEALPSAVKKALKRVSFAIPD